MGIFNRIDVAIHELVDEGELTSVVLGRRLVNKYLKGKLKLLSSRKLVERIFKYAEVDISAVKGGNQNGK